MKKVLALTITMAILFTMTAMAKTLEGLGTSESIDVKASYVEGAESAPVYSVDITWGSMEFTYTAADKGEWLPDEHKYANENNEGKWSCETGANEITVTNHSNAPINISVDYNSNEEYQEIIQGSFENDKSTFLLNSAVGTSYSSAPCDSILLNVDGTLPQNIKNVTIGHVTISISDNKEEDSNKQSAIISTVTLQKDVELNNLKSTGLVIYFEGTNLNNITKETLEQFVKITVVKDGENIELKYNENNHMIYSYSDDGKSASIEYTATYFNNKDIGEISEVLYQRTGIDIENVSLLKVE